MYHCCSGASYVLSRRRKVMNQQNMRWHWHQCILISIAMHLHKKKRENIQQVATIAEDQRIARKLKGQSHSKCMVRYIFGMAGEDNLLEILVWQYIGPPGQQKTLSILKNILFRADRLGRLRRPEIPFRATWDPPTPAGGFSGRRP